MRPRTEDLGDLQAAVLEIVWQRGGGTVAEVQEALRPDRRFAYTTILTALRSLERRGLLRHEQRERTYVYVPTVPAEEVRRGALSAILRRHFGGSPARLVAALLDSQILTPEEMAEIRSLVLAKEAPGEPD